MTDDEILENNPSLKKEYIKIALQYGAILAREEILLFAES